MSLFFNNWPSLGRVLLLGTLAYAAMILFIRIAGARSLAKLNAFDLVVTVALGSTLASVLLSKSVALADGVAAMALLLGLQYLVSWSSTRVQWLDRVVKSEPRVVYYRGSFIKQAMLSERLTQEEVLSAMRQGGHMSTKAVTAVILESSGDLSVVTDSSAGSEDALRDARNDACPPDERAD